METIDDTGFGGVQLIQDKEGFRYGIDAVLLADFADRCCGACETATELGCGNGIVSLLLAHKRPALQVRGIDFQEKAVDLAARSAAMNGMDDRVQFTCCDIAELKERHPEMGRGSGLVVSNPPYIAGGSGIAGKRPELLAARQETTADLETFIECAAWLLKGRGSFCMVHRPFRLVDIFYYCRKHRLEPKRIRFVHPKEGQPPNIVLIQAASGGGPELKYDPPLYVYGENGEYSGQILEIYGRERTVFA